jgi:hypothetical protein
MVNDPKVLSTALVNNFPHWALRISLGRAPE